MTVSPRSLKLRWTRVVFQEADTVLHPLFGFGSASPGGIGWDHARRSRSRRSRTALRAGVNAKALSTYMVTRR